MVIHNNYITKLHFAMTLKLKLKTHEIVDTTSSNIYYICQHIREITQCAVW